MNNACVVFLIEEASEMQMRIAEGTHSKIESIATAINSAIRQMEGRPTIDVALLGYRCSPNGDVDIGSRFGGMFEGRAWASSDELVANPIRTEVRTKRMVNPVTRSVTPMTVDFPIWYEPKLGFGNIDRLGAYDFLSHTLRAWIHSTQPVASPMIFSFLSDLQPGESIANAVAPLGQVSTPQGFPQLLQFHAGAYANVPAIKYPTVPQVLPNVSVQELFFACSPLNDSMIASLRQSQEYPAPGAKGLVYNGRMIDMVRMLDFLKFYQMSLPAYATSSPVTPNLRLQSEAHLEKGHCAVANRIHMPDLLKRGNVPNPIFETFDDNDEVDDSLDNIPSVENLPEVNAEIIPAGFEYRCCPRATNKQVEESPNLPSRQTLLVLLVDRSISSLIYKPALETWERRNEKTRFMLGEIARRGRGRYDTALVFYGKERDGSMSAFSGALGKTYLSDNCLAESAGLVENTTIHIPNGIGGLLSLPRKRLGFADCTPTYPADPTPGFKRVVEIIKEWEATRQEKVLPPVVLHITSAKFQMDRLDNAIALLSDSDLSSVLLHHWVFTERPHTGVCCPGSSDFTTDADLLALWERSDALPARETLAGVRPGIHELSRGIMVNMDFDVLFEVLDTQAQKYSQNK